MNRLSDPIIMPGAYVAVGVDLQPGVSIGRHAVILGPDEPSAAPTVLEEGVSIGANATVMAGVVIGIGAHVLPGAVVSRSVPAQAIVEGNPARIVGYVDSTLAAATGLEPRLATQGPTSSRVAGVSLVTLPSVADLRGRLAVAEVERDLPFVPSRFFLVYDVPSRETRGAHAHRVCEQLLVAVHGSLSVVVDDGHVKEEHVLESPDVGLHIPAMVWGSQYQYTADAVLLVLASHPYDAADYIRDYAEFMRLTSGDPTGR